MTEYKAPLRDIRFTLYETFKFDQLWSTLADCQDATVELTDAILEEIAKFSEFELSPLNRVGDTEGCTWHEEGVTTPAGFKEAYALYTQGGWPGLTTPIEKGGQGMPASLGIICSEIKGSANYAWNMYPGLSDGCKATIDAHGSQKLKDIFMPKMVSGEWTGTMCLTEAHCGSDLGMLKTKAETQDDGTYKITGTKIFISSGEHDMAENIVHIVLARLPESPAGTKGISLFVVPKFTPDSEGNKGDRNAVSCGSIEHKMGIHGNATCVMNFDGATGYLIGDINRGLNCMFTFMNSARVGTAMQGVCHGERALQQAVEYARDRLQMRSLTGVKNPEGPADPIIVHPDVRRMLLTIKSLTEGSRLLGYYLSKQIDVWAYSSDPVASSTADTLMALMTPIAKAFMTEVGFEAANHAIQVYGGHGYISEWGVEQNARDARIAMIYEGTNGIQSMDLLGRKILASGGKALEQFTNEVSGFIEDNKNESHLSYYTQTLSDHITEWQSITQAIGLKAMNNADEVGSSSFDYLMYSGYVTVAYCWVLAIKAAHEGLATNETDRNFYEAKLQTADFYFKRILPRTRTLVATLEDSADTLMNMNEEHFVF